MVCSVYNKTYKIYYNVEIIIIVIIRTRLSNDYAPSIRYGETFRIHVTKPQQNHAIETKMLESNSKY